MKQSRQIFAFLFSQREYSLFGWEEEEEEEEEEEGRVLPLTSLSGREQQRGKQI